MNKFTSFILLFYTICFSFEISSQNKVSHTLYLIGDGGKDTTVSPIITTLKHDIENTPNSTTIFLGDNIYSQGLEHINNKKKYRISKKKLDTQLEVFKNYKGNAFMIPGNHDWRSGKLGGKKSIIKEGEYVEEYINENTNVLNKDDINFIPLSALPGPDIKMLTQDLKLIAIDLQWWLHPFGLRGVGKVKKNSRQKMKKTFFRALHNELELAKKNNQTVIIAAHHPLFSNGAHGAKKQPWRFLHNWTPPGILLGLVGGYRYFSQDIEQPRYSRIKKKLLEVFSNYDGIIYASGHDHNLQYYKHDNDHYFVSGCGSKTGHFRTNTYNLEFADDKNLGYIKLSFLEDGKWTYEVITQKRN